MNQSLFNKLKKNSVHTYIHNGKKTYCLIHPDSLNEKIQLEVLEEFFDEEEGSVYYEIYKVVSEKTLKSEELIELNNTSA